MKMPASNSYFWIYLRQGYLWTGMIAFAMFGFYNHMNTRDIVEILTIASGLLGIDLVKHNAAPPPKE